MSVISVPRKEAARDDVSRAQSGYMTTTDVARLCGVSRFTVINWAREGKVKTIRTVGKHHRIRVSEALSLLRSLEEKGKASSPGPQRHVQQKKATVGGKKECGNCLTGSEQDERMIGKKKNILCSICYTIGRGAHILKERREAT